MPTRPANATYVRCYGCVRCQRYHYDGDDLFKAHLYFQSKHGITTRSLEVAKLERERQATNARKPNDG